MRQILACAAAAAFILLAGHAQSATPAKKTPPKKTAAGKTGTAARKSGAAPGKKTTSASHRTTAGPSSARKTGKKGTATTWRNRQTAPTQARYREIQDALAAKGYLKQENANGVWGPDSVDALKRFQADQRIESNGKLNSLSLIALGLGPKHDTVSAKPPVSADPASGRM
jgi:hypothetical protein